MGHYSSTSAPDKTPERKIPRCLEAVRPVVEINTSLQKHDRRPRSLAAKTPVKFRATTRYKSRGLETPWDHKTRRPSGTRLKYESQPCLICCWYRGWHYNVIVWAMASQITNLTIVLSTAYSGADQRKPQKAPPHWPLLGEFTGDQPIPCSKGQPTWKMFPFGDVIMWTTQHLHYSYVTYKRHCAWHLSHSTQCLYEALGRLTTKKASRLAFPISCEGNPSEWQKVSTAESTSLLWHHHDSIHTWQYFDEMITAWCFIGLFQRIYLLDQCCMGPRIPRHRVH